MNRGHRITRNRSRPVRLCIIVNPSLGLYALYRKQWLYWLKQGFDVHAIAGPGPEHQVVRKMGVTTHVIPIERYPSPFKDFVSLIRLWWFLLWHRFDIVHVSTPKAAFLGAIAARLSGHHRLIYTVRGRLYENMTGLKRKIANSFEWTVCRLARRVIAICHDLGDALVADGICPVRKMNVIGSGSSNGIDLERFTPTEQLKQQGRKIRAELGIGDEAIVLLCVGWLRKEKGTNETIYAFEELAKQYDNLHLVLLGNYELPDPLDPQAMALIETHPRLHHLAWRIEPAPIYALADIFIFPSYREGFGNVNLEAAAMGLPVVSTDVMGCREAVLDGHTGLLVPRADTKALARAIRRLIDNPQLRKQLGQNGRRRAEQEFRPENIWAGIHEQYKQLLASDNYFCNHLLWQR